ncbi:glutathione S-transferase [Kiloniella laminariae]|uniref:Glutathione S-transferase n=1 Tax=Kiloniella laminariae TaxID=454162 RepID=A0ABT4LIS3_9PROT|nr:glutathione S-transferase [Kiloniella laminariae]MCZ4281006.1 glutathione S-transferase [Kiloniella laminariae]
MIKLYRHPLSGHAHRVELFLSLLQLDYELLDVDLMAGAHKTAEFLKLHPFGQIPVLDDNGTILWDSNAILVYLARTYGAGRWLPTDLLEEAEVQAWLSVAAGQIAFGPAAARLVKVFGAQLDHEEAKTRAHALLSTIDSVLAERAFLTGKAVTIADVAAYSYIAHAPEGDVVLDSYGNVQKWLSRIEGLPNFVGMQKTPQVEAA